MNKRTIPKILLLLIGSMPLLLKAPYVIEVWRTSPLDQYDWTFVVLAVILTVIHLRTFYRVVGRYTPYFLLVVALGYVIYAASFYIAINTMGVFAGLIILWGMVATLWGTSVGLVTVPVLITLLLACPSTTYWMEIFIGTNGYLIKVIIAASAIILSFVICRTRTWRILLYAGVLLLLALYFFDPEFKRYEPLNVYFTNAVSGEFVGREVAIRDGDRRFFNQSNIRRAVFADAKNQIALLTVTDFDNIHKIHPTGHCLRSAGRNVKQDSLTTIQLEKQVLQINECITEDAENTVMLVWTWYGNSNFSTGNFIYFRKQYNENEDWAVWQIAITTSLDELDDARKTLIRFVTTFCSEV